MGDGATKKVASYSGLASCADGGRTMGQHLASRLVELGVDRGKGLRVQCKGSSLGKRRPARGRWARSEHSGVGPARLACAVGVRKKRRRRERALA